MDFWELQEAHKAAESGNVSLWTELAPYLHNYYQAILTAEPSRIIHGMVTEIIDVAISSSLGFLCYPPCCNIAMCLYSPLIGGLFDLYMFTVRVYTDSLQSILLNGINTGVKDGLMGWSLCCPWICLL